MLGMAANAVHPGVMKRTRKVPAPSYLSASPPVPKPEAVADKTSPAGEEQRLDPTRYGDWEKKGIAIDF